MPTPKRTEEVAERAAGGADGSRAVGTSMGTPREGWSRGPRRENPSPLSGHEEACDKRSVPQDVTSSWTDAKGSICNKRSSLTRPKDLPRDSPFKATSRILSGS
jgi:hypothetical protein